MNSHGCALIALSIALLLGGLACSRADGTRADPVAEPQQSSKPGPPGAGERSPAPERREVAVLAGGCFWGMEELLRKVPGVIDTSVGYTGGSSPNPVYEDVHEGTTGHAESVRIEFDPARITYEQLLLYFFKIHDPTTGNRQGNDIGSQYRSAIFVDNAEQRAIAERVKARVQASGEWDGPITTEIATAGTFTPAEDYHQDYLQRIPGGYTCHYERDVTF